MGKNKKELKFRIGDRVKIDMRKEIRVVYEDKINSSGKEQQYKTLMTAEEELEKCTLSPMPEDKRRAVITGMKIFCEGWHYASYQSSPSYFDPVGDYEPGGIDVQKVHYLWCVRFGYVNKEHYFRGEDILRILDSVGSVYNRPMYIPFKDTGWNTSTANRYRKQMSRESKSWPRDSKGRWSK
jgi:hypothetical protein